MIWLICLHLQVIARCHDNHDNKEDRQPLETEDHIGKMMMMMMVVRKMHMCVAFLPLYAPSDLPFSSFFSQMGISSRESITFWS